MSIITLIAVLVGILVAWKIFTGVIKLGVIALIVVAGFYFFLRGGM